MNWIVASIAALVAWGSYSIFGEKATKIHGEKVSFVFELLGMAIVALVVFATMGGFGDFKKLTGTSAANAIIMGLLVSLGSFLVLYAFRVVPSIHQIPIVVIIAGFYPIVTAILSHFFLGSRLSVTQWIGVVLAGAALTLINWKH